jgi:hypothetical protein
MLESLKSRAGLLVSGAVSFVLVVGGMRLPADEPVVQPQTDIGIVVGVAMVSLFIVINDMCGGTRCRRVSFASSPDLVTDVCPSTCRKATREL